MKPVGCVNFVLQTCISWLPVDSLPLSVDRSLYQACLLRTTSVIPCNLGILYRFPQFLKRIIIAPATPVGLPFHIIHESAYFIVCKFSVFPLFSFSFKFLSLIFIYCCPLSFSLLFPALSVYLFLFVFITQTYFPGQSLFHLSVSESLCVCLYLSRKKD